MKSINTLFFGLLLILLGACDPDPVIDPPISDPGTFIAKINGVNWSPPKHYAVYYPKWEQLFIFANDVDSIGGPYDNRFYLKFGVDLSTQSGTNFFLLEPNGTNEAILNNYRSGYRSSDNVADAGGQFTLIALDTVNKKLSVNLRFVAYSDDRTEKKQFETVEIKDISVRIDTTSYTGEFVECTISGVKNSTWKSKDFYRKGLCGFSTPYGPTLSFEALSITDEKKLMFGIPTVNGPGTYSLFPYLPPYSYCGAQESKSWYGYQSPFFQYFPISGTITITELDMTAKRLSAEFSATYRDTSARLETIRITNGKLRMIGW